MKQTNNAIKFLMAQYRAIFKNAYFKGMATALVLTAGLAAGQAQATASAAQMILGIKSLLQMARSPMSHNQCQNTKTN